MFIHTMPLYCYFEPKSIKAFLHIASVPEVSSGSTCMPCHLPLYVCVDEPAVDEPRFE